MKIQKKASISKFKDHLHITASILVRPYKLSI